MPSHARKLPFIGVACVLALLLSASLLAPNRAAAAHAQTATPQVSGTLHFIQTATTSNIFGDATLITNPATNNKPHDLLFVTPNWNPSGPEGIYDNHPIGVWYDASVNQWAVLNEDAASMPVGAAFNVLVVPKAGGSVFVHTATSSNTVSDYTLITNAATNGKPSAKLFITQNVNPGSTIMLNNHNVGVFYQPATKEWGVFNEDLALMTTGVSFNVLVGGGSSGGGKAFLQTATTSNTIINYTLISNSLTTDDANAIVFATQNWNPNGKGGTYNNAAIGVFYDVINTQEWSVFNQNTGQNMPIGAAFNILAFAS